MGALIILYALLDTTFTIFAALFVNWWAPVFATSDAKLPNWLTWFDTFDDDLDTGVRTLGWAPGYLSRVRWLYRNIGYGFGYYALGCDFLPELWAVKAYTEQPFTFYAVGPGDYFNYHVVRAGIRIKVGWKAWNMYQSWDGQWRKTPWGPEMRIPFVFSISLA